MTDTLDPLATSGQITSAYRRYLRSLLPIRDEAIAAALDHQVATSRLLSKGPYLEATPPYETGASLADLIADGVLDPGMRALDGPESPLSRPLYRHQDQAIRKAVGGRNIVVATGTGSGKTESFLFPILNSLAVEQSRGTLGPGVRALLLYPMNALANDQMKRLRKLLAATPQFTFGRYTGDTEETPRKARDLFESLNPGESRLPNELLSREEMRATPPHLLLTNYAMLEYLLLRPVDLDLFEGEYRDTWKFIAVDEAHVYDGAKAAEMAMLLRRLHDRVAPDRPLQCLATSATVGDDKQAVMKFASQLFATPFEWIHGDSARQDLVGPTRKASYQGTLWGPLAGADYRKLAELAEPSAEVTRMAAEHGVSPATPDKLLASEQRMADLKEKLAGGPRQFKDLARVVFDPEDEPETSLAALVTVGARVHDESGTPALSARYHLFARATEGAYTCLSPSGPHVALAPREFCDRCSSAAFELGACQRCGAVYLTGTPDFKDGKFTVVPSKRDEQRIWLLLDDAEIVTDEDEQVLDEEERKAQSADNALLCTGCGAFYIGESASCCAGVALRRVQRLKSHSRSPRGCLKCGARSSTIRLFESGQDAAVSVMSTALYQALPPDEKQIAKPGGGRKLLLFSDSRQRAAFFAPYLNNSYSGIQHRRLIWDGLRTAAAAGEVHVDDLIESVTTRASIAGVFGRRASRTTKTRETGLWVMRELVAIDDRQSLEGRGLLRVMLAPEPGWRPGPALAALGLSTGETWHLLSELARSLRQQGVLTMPENVPADDDSFAPRRGPIYVRRDAPDRKVLSWLPAAGRNRRLDYVERVLHAIGSAADPRQVLTECWEELTAPGREWLKDFTPPGLGAVRQVNHEWLDLEPADDNYQCGTCRRFAPASVREVCPTNGCQGTLQKVTLPQPGDDLDHYRLLYRSMDPVPLLAKEHTAQWTGQEAARIQQDFLNGDVNVLSCSTTFELGVDVGELQSVVMRNMPPTTANYVQRAGRAGRRTASAALVVTYAQRASHDLSRYQNPEEMIAGEVRAPYVPIGNERIDRRHAHSVALAAFFRYGKHELSQVWKTAGQFFLPSEEGCPAPVTMVGPFLTPVSGAIAESLGRVLPPSVQREIGVANGGWAIKLTELLDEVRQQLDEEIQALEERRQWAFDTRRHSLSSFFGRIADTVRNRDLIGYLASRNVLPKYGFPVDTVDFMTKYSGEETGSRLELSRDLASAIYEYAPGAEVVAGGLLWTSAGIYRRPGRELTGKEFAICGSCGDIQVSDGKPEPVCPKCQFSYANGDRRGRYIIPEFGFLASPDVSKPGTTPPNRSWQGETYVLDLAAEPEEHRWRSRIGAIITARAGARGRLLALSEGPSRRGFLICPACGWGTTAWPGQKPPKSHKDPVRGKECTSRLQTRFLAHSYETDLLALDLDPGLMSSADQSTLQSTLAAILEGAADRLQISRDDIGGTLYSRSGGRRALIVYDTVPAGAGNALRIARSLDQAIAGALERVENCDCGVETSCYGCLRNYRNQWIHEELRRDRALAVLHRIEAVERESGTEPVPVAQPGDAKLPHIDEGTILVDTYTGQTSATVLADGRILMHGEVYADAQQAANAVDINVNALDFWAAELPGGARQLRDLLP